jgi:hypothetical protein
MSTRALPNATSEVLMVKAVLANTSTSGVLS